MFWWKWQLRAVGCNVFCWWQLCSAGANRFCWWQPCSAGGNHVLLVATMFCWWQLCSAVNRAVFSVHTVVDNKVVPLSLTANFSSYFWRRKTIVFFYFPSLCAGGKTCTFSVCGEENHIFRFCVSRKDLYFPFGMQSKIDLEAEEGTFSPFFVWRIKVNIDILQFVSGGNMMCRGNRSFFLAEE